MKFNELHKSVHGFHFPFTYHQCFLAHKEFNQIRLIQSDFSINPIHPIVLLVFTVFGQRHGKSGSMTAAAITKEFY